MITSISKFLLLENIQQAKAILRKKGLNPDEEDGFEVIKTKLESVPNLIGFFTHLRYEMGEDIRVLTPLMDWIINNRNLVGQLPQNILQYDTAEDLDDDIKALGRKLLIKKFYNSLYRSMKERVNKLEDDKRKEFDELSLAFMELPEDTRKLFTPLAYFEKNNISIEQFIESLKSFIETESVNQDKQAILDKLKKHEGKYKVAYDKDNVLAIQSNNKEVICDIGSQNWCIVYNPDSYANSYYGPRTNNTQYVVFNFNLPSSADNSMFGVTVTEEGGTKYGGSQNKRNQGVSLENILSYTGIPKGVLVPSPAILKMKQLKEDFIKLYTDKESDFIKISNYIDDKIKDDTDLNYDLFFDIISNHNLNSMNASTLISNTLKGKTLPEIKELFNNDFIKTGLHSLDNNSLVSMYLTLDDKETSIYLLTQLFSETIKKRGELKFGMESYLTREMPNLFRLAYLLDKKKWFENLLKNTSVTKEEVYKYMEPYDSEPVIDFFKKLKDKIIQDVMSTHYSSDARIEKFTVYKDFYDKYILPDETTPYERIFGYFENEVILMYLYTDDENFDDFVNFMVELVKARKDNKHFSIPKLMSEFIKRAPTSNYEDYYGIDTGNPSDFVEDLINRADIDLTENIKEDNIIGLYAYRTFDKYKSLFKKEMGIKTDEKGQDYVEVSDFTSFDDIIFEDEYFNRLEDYSNMDWYDLDEHTLEYWSENLDYYNTVVLSNFLLKDYKELGKYLSKNVVNNHIKEGKYDILLKDEYSGNEQLDKLRKNLIDLMFNKDSDDFSDPSIKDYIDDEVKKETIWRGLMMAEEASMYDYMWNSLIEKIGDELGGSYWEKDDEAIPRVEGNSIYKFHDHKLLFTIDLDYIVSNFVDSYYWLYQYAGDKFKWDTLVTYIKKELASAENMDYYFERSSQQGTNKRNFNDAIRNI